MKTILHAALLALLLSLNGCAQMLIRDAMGQGENLTPEQIKAYNEVGQSVIGCFQIGGPPPVGNTQWILVPKNYPILFKFGDNCHLVTP